jgi:hypothetical protein
LKILTPDTEAANTWKPCRRSVIPVTNPAQYLHLVGQLGLTDISSSKGNVAKWVKTVQNGSLRTDFVYLVHLIYSDGKIIIEQR